MHQSIGRGRHFDATFVSNTGELFNELAMYQIQVRPIRTLKYVNGYTLNRMF